MGRNIAKLTTILCTAGLLCGNSTNIVSAEEGFSYADVADLEFCFSSGVGAWGTVMEIREDGTFEGSYQDMNMGETGEGYPNGTIYSCDFSGQFSEPVKVNEYTYSAVIENITLEEEPGISEIVDGIQCIYSEPYGLDCAENILFYLPGAPLEELPEAYRSWVGYYDLSDTKDTNLPFTGLYNEAAEEGFSSYKKTDVSAEEPKSAIDMELEELAVQAAELEDQIDSGLLSQTEMNQLSGELYVLWDDELNSMWGRIKEILPKEAMDQLTAEELEWIAEKEAAVAEAGAEFEGGSMQPLVENGTAARLTRIRVYELADYLR